MKKGLVLLMVFAMPWMALAQWSNMEMTTQWYTTDETLTPEEGNFPPDAVVDQDQYLTRIRLQNNRLFPLYEAMMIYNDNNQMSSLREFRLAGMQALPQGFMLKGLYTHSDPSGDIPQDSWAGYVMGGVNNLRVATGFDRTTGPGGNGTLFSFRAKYEIGSAVIHGAFSGEDGGEARYVAGGNYRLPGQFIVGGLYSIWEDDEGWSVNVGRLNRPGDCAGLPSFAYNYVEVPTKYKWSNFRIMWGENGIHYIPPTFDNPIFSGMYDIDVALLLTELIPDNYRHYDSPLIFKRYDEYGSYAIRVNYIETPQKFRRFDANISANPGIHWGKLRYIRGIVTYERVHNPVFQWQDPRYHLNIASMIDGQLYTGITYSTDFDNFERIMIELRLLTQL